MNQEAGEPLAARLARENALLRAKMEELERRLEAATAAAAAARAGQERFFAGVSHQLRTPLSAMTLWIKLLEEENARSPDRWREGLGAIRTCIEEQQKLLDDLLASSRQAAGTWSAAVPDPKTAR